jgi:hypothetical protein
VELAFWICAGGAVVFGVTAYLIWAIKIHRYIEIYRGEPALFFLPWAPMVDYRKARRIARRLRRSPGFLKWYRAIAWIAIAFTAAAIATGTPWLLLSS